MNFSKKLTELRKKAGLSQEELGYKLNVTRQTVSKWELGQTTPEMEKLVELSKVFSISVEDLVNGSDTNSNDPINTVIDDQPIKSEHGNKRIIIFVIAIVALILMLVIISSFSFTKSIFSKILGNTDTVTEQADGFFGSFFQFFGNSMDKINVSEFNSGISNCEGTNSGTAVTWLLDSIITSNKTKDRKIAIKYNDIETQDVEKIKEIKLDMDKFKTYEVSIEYDESGYVTVAKIEELITKSDISSFNTSFEMLYSGTKMGNSVTQLLDEIITNNKTKERKVTVKYNDTETQDEVTIREIKKNIETFDNYEIIFEYDAEGFINKAVIEPISKTQNQDTATQNKVQTNTPNTTQNNTSQFDKEFEEAQQRIEQTQQQIQQNIENMQNSNKDFNEKFEEIKQQIGM